MISVVIPTRAGEREAAAEAARGLIAAGAEVVLIGPDAPTVEGATSVRGGLAAGFEQVHGEVTVVQAPDPRWLPRDLDAVARPILDDAAEVVGAARSDRSLGDRALGTLARAVAEVQVSDPLSTRRAFRTQVLRDTALTATADDAELLVKIAAQLYRFAEVPANGGTAPRPASELVGLTRTLLRYATTDNDTDNAHDGYNTLTRMDAAAPNYNAWLGQRFREHAGPRVLEIGAGLGTITSQLANGREKLVALEVDAFFIRRLKNRFRGMPQVVPYLSDVALADVDALERERFDSLVLSNVMEHIPDDGDAVRKFAKILAPGGKVLILVPALPQIFGALDAAVGHYRRYTPKTLRAVLESNGFEIELLEWMNLVGIPGWFVNGKLLGRRSMPPLQLRLYDQLAPLLARTESHLKLPIGMSLFCVARRR